MDVGNLRHAIDVEAPIGVLDENDAVRIDSAVPMALTALPLAFQAREALGLGGILNATLYTVQCRYREDIRSSYVLREQCCTKRVFQILAIIPSDRRDALDMTCVTSG
jgi:hypothetical protein